MCSVAGCSSGRRRAARFKLPEDPEERLDWVMFLAKANKQRFKESSWTDITVCSEHFTEDCFVREADPVQLKPGAVPSVCWNLGPDEPARSSGWENSVVNTEVVGLSDRAETWNGATSCSEESRQTLLGTQNGPVPAGASRSSGSSVCFQARPRKVDIHLLRKKVSLLKTKGKFPVNEKRLVHLFSRTCPSCGGKLKMHKASRGVVIALHQLCLQCDYTYEWKSLVDSSVPAAEARRRTGGSKAAAAGETPCSASEVPEVAAAVNEESDPEDDLEESSGPVDTNSDEDWRPAPGAFTVKLFPAKQNEGFQERADYCDYLSVASQYSRLCTDCGAFFDTRKRHACKHKVKPYSCNICGKRCVSEVALNQHGRVHGEDYEFRCKFCHTAFKVQVDKISHELSHAAEEKPYKCSDCLETFATNKERRIHLKDHRRPKPMKCRFCRMEFVSSAGLQRHLAVHMGLKPFTCLVCQRAFSQAGHLKSHMRLHTVERPYECQHCDKRFSHNASLKSHVRRHHAADSGPERDSGDAQANRNETGEDFGFDSIEDEQATDDDAQMEELHLSKLKQKSTGRPKGRPKNFGSRGIILEDEAEGRGSNTGGRKAHAKKQNMTQFTNEDGKDTTSDSNTSFDSAEEEETTERKANEKNLMM
ncbi:zinc finger and SCAN domain-containing protein 10 [Kryptolebias marmoratus]|uniref:Zinc finger and SCAN domain-containing protein 10-like n=1 Tax=Kryptolebias marmoratus TaxID=37003 RepID=A0A3Q3AFQ5_KRYMA|nr:zinc finger and SCAN domain-containing protein 10 [Kryptolebias marmoratus]